MNTDFPSDRDRLTGSGRLDYIAELMNFYGGQECCVTGVTCAVTSAIFQDRFPKVIFSVAINSLGVALEELLVQKKKKKINSFLGKKLCLFGEP